MDAMLDFPSFDNQFPQLDQFVSELAAGYNAGKIKSWEDLEQRVNSFFTPVRMEQMEAVLPHWRKMALYANGLTLVHVMCVFMGLYRMPEFMSMSKSQQQLLKWIILFHDVEKELPDGKRDHGHAFRSAVGAARTLPLLGFPATKEYNSIIDAWDEFTRSALINPENSIEIIQDNGKLPQILDGIRRMFGHNTPAALIIKTVLFHLSVDMNFWPPPSPLSGEEVEAYFDHELTPLLLVMNLGDNDGWNIFKPEIWEPARTDTVEIFKKLEKQISK